MKKEPTIQEYAEQVKKFTPKFSSGRNCWHAFVSGGAICFLGEIIHQFAVRQMDMSQENDLSALTEQESDIRIAADPLVTLQASGIPTGICVRRHQQRTAGTSS